MEAANCLYEENIASGLGFFRLRINATNKRLSVEIKDLAVVVQSVGYTVTIKEITAPTSWLPVGMQVDVARAWLTYITKHSAVAEQLRIDFTLPAMPATIRTGADTGQWLTAIEFEDGIRQVHIGTQDEEWFSWCKEVASMPTRLVPIISNGLLITNIVANGLVTSVPELLVGEQFYLHYILAESARRKSAAYPNEWDVSTWYAVDQSQKSLAEAYNKQTDLLSKDAD